MSKLHRILIKHRISIMEWHFFGPHSEYGVSVVHTPGARLLKQRAQNTREKHCKRGYCAFHMRLFVFKIKSWIWWFPKLCSNEFLMKYFENFDQGDGHGKSQILSWKVMELRLQGFAGTLSMSLTESDYLCIFVLFDRLWLH